MNSSSFAKGISRVVIAGACCVSSLAVAQPTSPASPASPASPGKAVPPSTGRELAQPKQPELSPETAGKIVAEAVKLAARESECASVVGALQVALPYAVLTSAEAQAALTAQQRCGIKTKRWNSVIRATSGLLAIDPAKASPDEMIRAMVELGQYDRAAATLQQVVKKYPRTAPELSIGLSLALCRQEKWAQCAKVARASIDRLGAARAAPAGEPVVRNRLYLAQALIGLGDLKGYAAERAILAEALGARASSLLDPLDSQARTVGERKMWLRATPAKLLPLGTYHLMGKPETGVMATVRLLNHDARERSFRLEAEVQGATERSVRSFKVGRGKGVEITATPPLSLSFDVSKIRAKRPGQLALKLVETTGGKERIWIDETAAIDVLPRDYLPLVRYVGGDHPVRTREYTSAWIMPNSKPVEELLAKAKQRLARRTFAGEQSTTVDQVKAIYDELQARGVSYVMDPTIDLENVFMQRTRLPSEVLSSTNAQCLEGTLLFATLLESIGLRPIVVFVPGHAFVGWHTSPKDKQDKRAKQMFLETTLVGSAPFERALEVAAARVIEEAKAGNLQNGTSELLDVASLRKRGYAAQPYE